MAPTPRAFLLPMSNQSESEASDRWCDGWQVVCPDGRYRHRPFHDAGNAFSTAASFGRKEACEAHILPYCTEKSRCPQGRHSVVAVRFQHPEECFDPGDEGTDERAFRMTRRRRTDTEAMAERLRSLLGTRTIVSIPALHGSGNSCGVPLMVTDDFVLLAQEFDFKLVGLELVRLDVMHDVDMEIWRGPVEMFAERVMSGTGRFNELDAQRRLLSRSLDLTSLRTFIEGVRTVYGVATLLDDCGPLPTGVLEDVSEAGVTVREIGPDGYFAEDRETVEFEDVIGVEFGSDCLHDLRTFARFKGGSAVN